MSPTCAASSRLQCSGDLAETCAPFHYYLLVARRETNWQASSKESPTAEAKPELDELEEYLAEPEETDIELKLLAWWKVKESKWPALAKMVKQYFAAPASSAGVERIFSAAGKMHGDLQKAAKDSTLEHSLFANSLLPSTRAKCCRSQQPSGGLGEVGCRRAERWRSWEGETLVHRAQGERPLLLGC